MAGSYTFPAACDTCKLCLSHRKQCPGIVHYSDEGCETERRKWLFPRNCKGTMEQRGGKVK